MTEEDWKEYARLLRQARCNPSYKPWQEAVSNFEWEHLSELDPYFEEWRRPPDEKDDLSS